MGMLDLEGAHWTFSLTVYGEPGVAEACVALQDRCGVDVNVLLLTLFTTRLTSSAPSAVTLAEADCFIREWRGEIVKPLRAIRRRLKLGPAPAPGGAAEVLRQRIKSAELFAEQIEQAALAAWFEGRDAGSAATGGCAEALARVIAFYAQKPMDDPIVRAEAEQAMVIARTAECWSSLAPRAITQPPPARDR